VIWCMLCFIESLLELFEQAWYMLCTFYNNRKKSIRIPVVNPVILQLLICVLMYDQRVISVYVYHVVTMVTCPAVEDSQQDGSKSGVGNGANKNSL
jgi:hypothetical protein